MLKRFATLSFIIGCLLCGQTQAAQTTTNAKYFLCTRPAGEFGEELDTYFAKVHNDESLKKYRLQYEIARCSISKFFIGTKPEQDYISALEAAVQGIQNKLRRVSIIGIARGVYNSHDKIIVGSSQFFTLAKSFCDNSGLSRHIAIDPRAAPYCIPLCYVAYKPKDNPASPGWQAKKATRVKILQMETDLSLSAPQKWSVTLYRVGPGYRTEIVKDIPL